MENSNSRAYKPLKHLTLDPNPATPKQEEEEPEFVLFTHHIKMRDNLPLQKNYKELREAVLELYLSVKIRTDEEIDGYDRELFLKEKKEMEKVNGFELVDLVKESVEKLMQMQ